MFFDNKMFKCFNILSKLPALNYLNKYYNSYKILNK